MRLFICEKRNVLKIMGDTGIALDGDVAFLTAGMGAWLPEMPQVSFSDIPFTDFLELDAQESGFLNGLNVKMLTGGIWVDVVEHGDLKQRLKKVASEAIETIVAVDNDRRGAFGAKQALDVIGDDREFSVMTFDSLAENELLKAWTKRVGDKLAVSRLERMASEQSIKKQFDALWFINSAKVLKETCMLSQGAKTAPISKMEMVTLKLVQKLDAANGSFTQNDILGAMQSTKSGNPVGSASSQSQILHNMMSRGFFELVNEGFHSTYKLHECAKRFIDRCHPESFDLSLPDKLEKWMSEQDLASAIAYIDTYFRRQLQYQRKFILG